MNRSASHNHPQGSGATVDDELSRGSAVIHRVTALTSDLVYMLSRDAVMTRMTRTADTQRGLSFTQL